MGKVRARTLGDEEQELKEKQEAEARRLAKIEEAKAKGQAAKKDKAANDEEAKSQEPSAEGEEKISEVLSNEVSEEETKEESPVETSVISDESEKSQSTNNESEESEDSSETEAPQNDNGALAEQSKEKTTEEKPVKKMKKQKIGKAHERSEKYKTALSQVEKSKLYSLTEALELVEKTHLAKFDETVELHINTTQNLNGSVTLPHGTGKSTRVAILNPNKDEKAADDLIKAIESGKIEFDILIATPDAMPRLAKVARVLGPKGLMPNPKNGTVTPNPEATAEKYAGGHMTFKTESKAPVLHLSVGKLSFGKDKLEENIKAAMKAIDLKNMKRVTLKSTMSPGIKIQLGK